LRCVCFSAVVAATVPVSRAPPEEPLQITHDESEARESTTVGQADVREMQNHPPARAGPRHLLKSTSQAAAGVNGAYFRG
jgi:hypothetical protein